MSDERYRYRLSPGEWAALAVLVGVLIFMIGAAGWAGLMLGDLVRGHHSVTITFN